LLISYPSRGGISPKTQPRQHWSSLMRAAHEAHAFMRNHIPGLRIIHQESKARVNMNGFAAGKQRGDNFHLGKSLSGVAGKLLGS
jgi:hypothetical protein